MLKALGAPHPVDPVSEEYRHTTLQQRDRSNSAIAACIVQTNHRLQNAGVVLNRRHLLRSVFATAIRSRACQPATAPIAS